MSRPRIPSAITEIDDATCRALAIHDAEEFDAPMTTAFLRDAGTPAPVGSPQATPTVAQMRGYDQQQLDAIAEMAHQYIYNGGYRLAVTLLEGLVAVAPQEPRYLMLLGVCYTHIELRRRAAACFASAARLDPTDARPELNLAELAIFAGRSRAAEGRLRLAMKKARASGDRQLEKKAAALVGRLRG